MNDESHETQHDSEGAPVPAARPAEPEVYRIAQIDAPVASAMDRRTFVKATVATVGAAAIVTAVAGCDVGAPDTCTCETDPSGSDGSEETSSDVDVGIECECDAVCTCEAVCACDTECSCDSVCTCEAVCTCESDCTCETDSGSHYWYPT